MMATVNDLTSTPPSTENKENTTVADELEQATEKDVQTLEDSSLTKDKALSCFEFYPLKTCPAQLIGHRVESSSLFFPDYAKTVEQLIATNGIREPFRMNLELSNAIVKVAPADKFPNKDYDIPIAVLSSEVDWPKNALTQFHEDGNANGQVRDIFSEDFILAAIITGTIDDLNKYKMRPSRFFAYDANDILYGRKKWSELTVNPAVKIGPTPRSRKRLPVTGNQVRGLAGSEILGVRGTNMTIGSPKVTPTSRTTEKRPAGIEGGDGGMSPNDPMFRMPKTPRTSRMSQGLGEINPRQLIMTPNSGDPVQDSGYSGTSGI